MKHFSIVIFLLFLLQNTFAQTECLNLIWSDEFDYTGVPNPDNWNYDIGDHGWGNNEIQNYTSSTNNSYVDNGILTITATKTGNNWTSARLKSNGKQEFQYGKLEFRAKLPEGSGTWPALWMLGGNFPTAGWPNCGEIDIMEHIGRDPGVVHGSLHSPSSYGGTQNTSQTSVPDFADAFHTYAIVWTEEFIKFFVDDVQYYVYAPSEQDDANWPFNQPFFFIMNIAMGGNWGSDPQYETDGLKNGIDPNLTSATMEVDYVRVYELSGTPKITGENFINENQQNLTYACNDFPSVNYNWTVPEGVEIVSGQGTNEINVNWGSNEGTLRVDIEGTIQCDENFAELDVFFLESPTGNIYSIDDFEDGNQDRWDVAITTANSISLNESGGEMEVTYNITDIGQSPHFYIELTNPIDFSQHPIFNFDLKTTTNTAMIVYMVDAFGVQSNLFPFSVPINADGTYHPISFDFSNKWRSDFPNIGATVDSSKIKRLEFYLNVGNGSLSMDNLTMEFKETTDLASTTLPYLNIYPNPAQDFIYIEAQDFNQVTSIGLYDLTGKKVYEKEVFNQSKKIQVDVSNLEKGMYFLSWTQDGANRIQKIVIE